MPTSIHSSFDKVSNNGNIFYSTQAALDTKILEILRVVDEIQTHSRTVIEHCDRAPLRALQGWAAAGETFEK